MEDQYMSLYDYLGKAAGTELGKKVFNESVVQKVTVKSKTVNNPKYSGKVFMYPKQFLELYFKKS